MYNDEFEVLSEIYDLTVMHYDIIKESIKRDHLIAVSENDPQIVVESFKDITNKMGDLIKALIKKFTDFAKKVFNIIKTHTQSVNKFYNKHKDVLLSMTGIDFYIDGYEFTVDEVKPNLAPFYQMIDEYNKELASIPTMTVDAIKTRQNNFINDGHLNSMRGDISGLRHPIEADKFVKVLRAAYRGGVSNGLAGSIHVTDDVFHYYMAKVPSIINGAKEAETIKDNTLDALRRVESFFNDKVPVIYASGTNTMKLNRLSHMDSKVRVDNGNAEMILEEERDKVEIYVRYKYNQAHEIANIAAVTVMEYANAYKDYMVMIRTMIQRAVFKGKVNEGGEI